MTKEFINLEPHLGTWDVQEIINDISRLFDISGIDWKSWQYRNIISTGKYKDSAIHNLEGNVNLTSNSIVCPTLEDKLFQYAGRRYHERLDVNDHNLYQLIPELENTYTGAFYKKMVELLGPVRMRLFNKSQRQGLYWHRDNDALSLTRHHLVLWTNPGHFLVWTDKNLQWRGGYSESDCKTSFDVKGRFMAADGNIYGLQTGEFIHGVAGIGVGYESSHQLTSRCHMVISQIIPTDPKV